jgi:hypothetical protein
MQSINPMDLSPEDSDNPYAPPKDPVFDVLFGLAINRDLQVYFAAIPLALIKPFDPGFRFLDTPSAQSIIGALIAEAQQGRFPHLWVYETGEGFVMSDDYPQYEACLRGQPDYVPCWVFGRPRHPAVIDVQGPVNAREAAGLQD